MCLFIDEKKHENGLPIVLKEDLIVLKQIMVFEEKNKLGIKTQLRSPFRPSYFWEKLELRESILNYMFSEVDRGFHSIQLNGMLKYEHPDHYFEFPIGQVVDLRENANNILAVCVIPKGSRVFYGQDNDIVSDNIFILDTFECYEKLGIQQNRKKHIKFLLDETARVISEVKPEHIKEFNLNIDTLLKQVKDSWIIQNLGWLGKLIVKLNIKIK